MYFKKIETKGIAHFSYMVGDEDYIAVIDPVRDMGIYMQEARKSGMKIKYILETHRNEDYLSGARELSEKTGATIYISGHEDVGYTYGEEIKDGFELEIGDIIIKAIHTPGHTLGHLSYAIYESGNQSPFMVFTGDCLFMGDAGRTDFYGKSNVAKMTGLLYDSIFEKLLPLGEEVLMFPAHGAGSACGESMDERPFSTLGYEKKHSELLQVDSKKQFIENFAKMRIKPRYFDKMEELNVKGADFVGQDIVLNAFTYEEIIQFKDEVLLLDIRTKEAHIGGHIPDSIYMSKKSISTFLGAIFETDEKIVFVIDNNIDELEEIYWYCKRIGFDNILGYFPNASGQWENNGEELEKVSTISAKKYRETSIDSEFILLDIRKSDEIEESDPDENRINIPLHNIYKCLAHLSYDLPTFVLCNSGERATIGYSYLKRKGYNPIVITGGVKMLEALEEK